MEKTGYASIDKPWLQYYDDDALSKALNAPKDKTIWQFYKPILESYGDTPVVKYFNHEFSAEEYLNLIEMWARTFKAMGVEPDEMVPVYGTWSPDIAAMFFSLNAIGAHPYFQKLEITPEALKEETAASKVAVVHSALWAPVQDVFKDDHFKKVIMSSPADLTKGPLKQMIKASSLMDAFKTHSRMPKDDKFITADDAREIGNYYTGEYEEPFKPGRLASITSSSGTSSSMVKGIMDTNEGILANIVGTAAGKPNYIPGHKVLTSTPPTASTALNCLYLLPLYYHMTCIMDPLVGEKKFYEQIRDYKPNIAIMTGAYFESFFRKIQKELEKGENVDLSFAEFFTIGGSGTTPEKLARMNEIMKKCGAPTEIFIGYGSSELFGVVSVDKNKIKNPNADKKLVTDVGLPLPGFTVAAFDENGNELPYNTRGELRITGPSLMEGYYGKPELSKKAIQNGWFVTGDIGEVDENGFIYFYGRKKDTIKIGEDEAYLFDIANAIRTAFSLKECYAERKRLTDGTDSVVIYFVQDEDKKYNEAITCQMISAYAEDYGVTIDGYRIFDVAIPTSPTTIKPVTRLTDGFVRYDNDTYTEISYQESSETDVYAKHEVTHERGKSRILKK